MCETPNLDRDGWCQNCKLWEKDCNARRGQLSCNGDHVSYDNSGTCTQCQTPMKTLAQRMEAKMKEDAGKPVEKLEWKVVDRLYGEPGKIVMLLCNGERVKSEIARPGIFRSVESSIKKVKEKLMADYLLDRRESCPAFVPHPRYRQDD